MLLSNRLIARGGALFLGSLAALDVAFGPQGPRDTLLSWWSSSYPLSAVGQQLFAATAAALLVSFAIAPRMALVRQRVTQALLLVIAGRCIIDTAIVGALAHGGTIQMRYLPLSLLFGIASLWILRSVNRSTPSVAQTRPSGRTGIGIISVATSCALLFAFAQMVGFGNTDYRRPADAVVVFGARVYADGRPSLALADRVRTAAALVRDGYAPMLIVSGGPGDGNVHEVEAMRALAIEEGVPAEAIVLDPHGLDTRSTVRNSLGHARRVIAVSHGYHLPRIKLTFQQLGGRAYTVPARETRTLIRLPFYMARESLAFWAHAFRVA